MAYFPVYVYKEIPKAPLYLPQETVTVVLSSFLSFSSPLYLSLSFSVSPPFQMSRRKSARQSGHEPTGSVHSPISFSHRERERERERVTEGCVSIRPGVSSEGKKKHYCYDYYCLVALLLKYLNTHQIVQVVVSM